MIAVAPPETIQDGVHLGAFKERFELRVKELASDLALPERPRIDWKPTEGTGRLSIGGRLARPLRTPDRNAPSEDAQSAAERFATVVVRWRRVLLEPSFPPRDTLLDLCTLGMNLLDLEQLHRDFPEDDTALSFAAADRHAPRTALLLHRLDRPPKDTDFIKSAANVVARNYGLPIPVPTIETDAGLDRHRFRLRIGRVRCAVQPESWESPNPAMLLERALRRHLAGLFDVGTLISLLLDPQRVPAVDMARAALDDAPRIARALRGLLADGIGLVDPVLICEALSLPVTVLADWDNRVVSLAGSLVLPEGDGSSGSSPVTEVQARLRAQLVPTYLRRLWTDPESRASAGFYALDPAACGRLRQAQNHPETWVDRLLEAAAKIPVNQRSVLAVPGDLRGKVRWLTIDSLPDLVVVDARELPSNPRYRGLISVGDS